jgi:aminoglycoside phosphotransferase (APT) family kinase protein
VTDSPATSMLGGVPLSAGGPRVFPRSLEAITSGWLTSALRTEGSLAAGQVSHVDVRPVREPGQASTAGRLLLTLDGAPADAPRSLVAKLASGFEPVRRSARAIGLYEREVRFYQEIAPDAGIPVPRCYFAEIDLETGEFLLLLEDLSDCRNGDFWVSSLEDLTLAIDALAPFHARWWCSPALRTLAWVRQPDDAAYHQLLASVLRGCLPAVQQRWPARFAGYLGRTSARLAERWEAYAASLSGTPWTLVHTDFHPKQMFFPTAAAGRFAVFDWQSVAVGRAEADLSRILLSGLRDADLVVHQDALVARYHGALTRAGVDYPLERLTERTRLTMLNSLFIIIYALASTDVRILEESGAARGVDLEERLFVDMEQALERNRVLDLIP